MKRAQSSGSALGLALMVAGGAVLGLGVLWWLTYALSGEPSASALVFVVFLSLIVAGPLLIAGWLLRRRAPAEEAQTAALAERRTILDADAALRRELVRELDQVVAHLPGVSAGDAAADRTQRLLVDVRDDLARPGYSAAALLEGTAGLSRDQLVSVRRYDDLLTAEVRRVSELGPRGGDVLAEAAELLAQHVAEREALLGRGRVAAALRPQEMLEAGLAPRRRLDDPVRLALEDAVSYEGSDYVVRGVLDYFAGGRRWRVYQLHDGQEERWLEVRGDGAQLAMLTRLSAVPSVAGDSATHDGAEYRTADRGAATVSIESAAGRQEGILVEYRRLTSGSDVLTVEDWPDGARALAGRSVAREDLDLWTKPAAAE
ncbi:MAG TPA: DUF4178 domain-containing protein [Chloroflexota bacterium]|nr:DUF4178 domain-containing protein [Chloroflexota bacterium]